jgi:hypothetical protein
MHRKFNAFFPQVVQARYVRIHPKTWVSMVVMRAEVLYAANPDVYSGKHVFARCMETDQYTKLVNVGPLTEDESRNFTVPSDFHKSVSCPGCYECREVVNHPLYGRGDAFQQTYARYKYLRAAGFNWVVSKPGTADAVLTLNLLQTVRWFDYRLSWEHHNPEFICRTNPNEDPLEPDLLDDAEWTTFLLPAAPSPKPDAVINAIANGFHPPEAIQDWASTDQDNLAVVYPPGDQVDPAVTGGPYYNRQWTNFTAPHHHYKVPERTLNGERDGFWPPKPVLKVSFMPVITAGYWQHRLYPFGSDSDDVTTLVNGSKALGCTLTKG